MRRPDNTVHHPLFARFYARAVAAREGHDLRERGERLLEGLAGRALAIGAGTGVPFPLYPATVAEVGALERESPLRQTAEEEAQSAPVALVVRDGLAQGVAEADASF